MKRLFVAILACAILTMPAFARSISRSFACRVYETKMLPGTVYIDMLIPFAEDDDAFLKFNDENGKKYGISKDSEIATYNQEGFLSYTFHRKGAKAKIEPYFPSEDSESLFVKFLGDDNGLDREGFSAVDEFGEKYEKAKFAYIDANGKILGLTNEIDIWNESGYNNIHITLSGTYATYSMSKQQTPIFLTALFFVIGIFIFIIESIVKCLLWPLTKLLELLPFGF